MTERQDAEAVRASDRARGPGFDEGLYFGPCLPVTAEEAALREKLTAHAREIADKITHGEIRPGLPSGMRFEFTRGQPSPLDSLLYAPTSPWFLAQVRGTAPEPPQDGFMIPPGLAEDLRNALMDAYGLPRDLFTRELPPPTWRTRLRSTWNELRERAARRAFKIIAGYWPADGEDEW